MAGETSSGAADRSNSNETPRVDDPWRRVESEKPQRDAARKAWDAEHDPSPEFEYAIRPLPNDYGRDRPKHRELTEEQRTELEEVFGRPADELLALRDKDPRAGHNRDEQGRILGPDGQPRPDKTPEEMLREAQRQVDLYGPEAMRREQIEPEDAPDRQALSDTPDESPYSETTETTTTDTAATDAGDSGSGDDDGGGDVEQGFPDESEPDPNRREDLSELLGKLVHDLRDGDLSNDQAAEQLETFHESIRPEQIEVAPPDGKRLVVDIDEQGRPDLSNPRVEDGSSHFDQLQSTRRIAHDHGDQAAEPPKPAGDELSGDSERRDLKDSRSTTEQLMGTLFKRGDDLNDVVEAGGKTGQQIFEGPKEATAEVPIPQGEVIVVRPPPAHSDGADIATSIAALGLMIGAIHAKSRSNREQKDQSP